ncbi:Serine/threonine-protein kinase PknB [Pirellula sp. SH-Sr6A]|uniref:protein kinase domain-containing protein n=1 Tax=Pirellula sp. SH-Sr6A TaxID=1632865 RepID=UPI00078B38DB|nr:Hsp70 family protein [Pirellula sp. SH-Sr6A]AMV33090.1 Serine/threonine-protein kinase PknB [Pirellula sp. SH-Sr6A]
MSDSPSDLPVPPPVPRPPVARPAVTRAIDLHGGGIGADARSGLAGRGNVDTNGEGDEKGQIAGIGDFDPNSDSGEFELQPGVVPLDRGSDPKTPSLPVLGEYVILERIGAGGMGQVFRAKHRTMDREVALKILPQSMSHDALARERFYAEVRATAKLMHPNIVTAFDAGCHRSGDAQVHFLVMELIRGELLSQRIAASGPMSTREVVEILIQAASALEYAHSLGIVHRDIKPSNMMLTPSGTLKILDFGLAVLRDRMESTKDRTRSQIIGTVEFMAPEQINAPDQVDHRCDLYSLGATVFYLLTGRPMFSGELVQTALAQVHRRPPALYEVRADVDIRLDSVFQSLVAKNPDERLQSAAELIDKLQRLNLMEGLESSSRQGESVLPKISPVRPTDFGLAPSTSQRQLAAIGIELGMIHSRVSYIDREHKVEEVPVDGESTTLRNMLYSDGERVAVGGQAAELRASQPDRIFYGMQRWYGLPLLERPFGGRQVPPEVLVAAVVRQMVNATRHVLPSASHAVVTVPACYDQLHRWSTKTACSIAGIELLQLLEKPLAATLAHVEIDSRLAKTASEDGYRRTFLVAMLTGSSCEVSVVQVEGLKVRLIATAGDWRRGMVRWHDRMAKKIASELEKRFGVSAREDRSIASRIQRTVERTFERMRAASVVPFIVEVPGGKFEGRLDRNRPEEWVDELVSDCGLYAKEVADRVGIAPGGFDAVLLLGDARWYPSIQNAVAQVAGPKVPLIPLKSSHIARGAAIQAEYLMPPMDIDSPHAVSSTAYDLGVVMQDASGVTAPRILIPRDKPLSCQATRTLRFSKEGERQPVLQFVEGSRLGNSTWNKLGRVDLQTCFAGRRSSDPLQLRLEVDESGFWQGLIHWPGGNSQVPVSPLNEPLMDVVSIRQWGDWLESLMLCNG